MARKIRSDIKVGNLEKKLGLKPGAITNPDGTDARSDKKLGTLQKEFAKIKSAKSKPPTPKKTVAKKASSKSIVSPSTPDQNKASKRVVKSNPKASLKLAKKVSSAILKSTKK